MPSPATILALCALAWAAPLSGQQAPAVSSQDFYQLALEAIRDGIPQAAAVKLARAYPAAEKTFGRSGQQLIGERLIESLVRADRPAEALARCDDPALADLPSVRYWRGVALAEAGRASEAVATLRAAATDPKNPHAAHAALSCANILVRERQAAEALLLLASLPGKVPPALTQTALLRRAEIHLALNQAAEAARLTKELDPKLLPPSLALKHRFVLARLDLAQGNPGAAVAALPGLIEATREGDQRLHDAARILMAHSLARLNRREEAVTALTDFISQKPESTLLGEAFFQLERLGFFTESPPVLKIWEESAAPSLAAYALLYRSSSLPGLEGAPGLRKFLELYPKHPLVPLATLTLAQRLHREAPQETIRLLETLKDKPLRPEERHYAADLDARARFVQGDYTRAATSFLAAGGDSPSVGDLYNATVAAFQSRDTAVYDEHLSEVRLLPEGGDLSASLQLERALFLAAGKYPEALPALKDFTRDHPDHPRMLEASLAIAEFHLLEFPPRVIAARRQLETIRSGALSPALQEHADYVGFWIEIASENPDAATRAGEHFLKSWSASRRRAEVLMKVGELYFNADDFTQARFKFETLHKEDPSGPQAETALFFAAKAAMSAQDSKQAIALWAEVIDRKGPLAMESRRQQALSLMREGNPDNAIRVLDAILRSPDPIPADLRLAALLNRGQAFLEKSQQLPSAQESLIAAVAAFDEIIDAAGSDRMWRNQAMVFKAKCLELLDDDDQALEIYYDVVARSPTENLRADQVPEYAWYYRAGFAGIALLQEQRNWRGAANLADRLGLTEGSRAVEAAELAKRIRLQHFLWGDATDPPP
ncbi:MAG: Tetratricopeptide (TPR) repeat/Tetratricopeptide (TPR) repeat [Verrucomicrobia bacterium]|jgi:tetratricopeptide (TPR) repeat protein|nr:MAG: Tetratricopeptide (TPR) repeat/Tetratricopeptide (TPR) repeat [Verrucomicrobiota bacterium]